MLLPLLSRILRLASILACLIALASFAAFAIDQSRGASHKQQAEVNEAAPSNDAPAEKQSKPKQKSTIHKAIDEVFSALSSPFSAVTSNTSSQWTIHIVDTLLVLLVYGFGLSFLARLLPGRL